MKQTKYLESKLLKEICETHKVDFELAKRIISQSKEHAYENKGQGTRNKEILDLVNYYIKKGV